MSAGIIACKAYRAYSCGWEALSWPGVSQQCCLGTQHCLFVCNVVHAQQMHEGLQLYSRSAIPMVFLPQVNVRVCYMLDNNCQVFAAAIWDPPNVLIMNSVQVISKGMH